MIYRIDFSLEQVEVLQEVLEIACAWHKHEKKFQNLKRYISELVTTLKK